MSGYLVLGRLLSSKFRRRAMFATCCLKGTSPARSLIFCPASGLRRGSRTMFTATLSTLSDNASQLPASDTPVLA